MTVYLEMCSVLGKESVLKQRLCKCYLSHSFINIVGNNVFGIKEQISWKIAVEGLKTIKIIMFLDHLFSI